MLIFVLFMTACGRDFEYTGDYPELYTVAINSILGVRGIYARTAIGRPLQPSVIVLEEDNYGRMLFLYSEGSSHISPVNIVIMQKIEGDYVYFYPHYNFFSDSFFFLVAPPNEYSVATLKETNSWNQEMSDVNEFVRVRIVKQPELGPISDEKLVEAHRKLFPASNSRPNQIAANRSFLRTDRYGRSVYFMMGWEWGYVYEEPTRIHLSVALLFQPDHSFDAETGTLLITDLLNYQTDLRLFMEANGWDTPFNP